MSSILHYVRSIKPTPTQLPTTPVEVESTSIKATEWAIEAANAFRDAFSNGDNSMYGFYAMQDISMSSLDY